MVGAFPILPFRNLVVDSPYCKVLIRTKHFKNAICAVSNGIIADKLVCHWYRQEIGGNILPVILWHVVKVSPVEIKIFIETPIRSRIGKVNRLFGIHRHEDLNELEDTREDSFP